MGSQQAVNHCKQCRKWSWQRLTEVFGPLCLLPPMGWQRWRRQRIQQNRDKVIIFAQGWYGIFHVAEYSLLLGVKLKEPPLEVASRRDVLKKYGLMGHA